MPDGYKLEWGGEFESATDAQQRLGQGLPAGFLSDVLESQCYLFGRVRQPLIIWLVVPMAVVGVVSGLLADRYAFWIYVFARLLKPVWHVDKKRYRFAWKR